MAALVTYAPKLTGGVNQLQYVHGVDDVALGGLEDGPYFNVIKTGLLTMGVATLLGLDARTARWTAVVAVGVRLLGR